jgi:hypothetical protein
MRQWRFEQSVLEILDDVVAKTLPTLKTALEQQLVRHPQFFYGGNVISVRTERLSATLARLEKRNLVTSLYLPRPEGRIRPSRVLPRKAWRRASENARGA